MRSSPRLSAQDRPRPLEKGADWRTTGARDRRAGHVTIMAGRYGNVLMFGSEEDAASLLDEFLARAVRSAKPVFEAFFH